MPRLLKLAIVYSVVTFFSLSASTLPWYYFEDAESATIAGFNVVKHEYTFSTEFELEWQGKQYAHVIKSAFNLRSQYDIYDADGEFAGTGIGSWIPTFGLGWLYSWAADFTICDSQGVYLGTIHGTLYTDAVAKFIFTDATNSRIAVAYMDKERTTFTIHSPGNITKKILELGRQVVPYKKDYWTLLLYNDSIIPPQMVQIFAVFACDRQDDFKIAN